MFSPRFCNKISNIAKTKIKYINITQKHKMKYKAKYSRVWDNDVKPIQKPPQPTIYTCGELCSIPCKDNYSLLENTLSQANIISKGFFQTEAQKALQNSQIEKAFEIAEQYIQTSKRKFYRFLDVETKKLSFQNSSTALTKHMFYQPNRNSKAYSSSGLDTTSCT